MDLSPFFMFLNPARLDQYTPAEILLAAAQGHIGIDHRFLKALLDRPEEAKQAALAFTGRDRDDDPVDLEPELIALFREWKTADAIPFLVRYIKEDPEEIPEEVVEFLVKLGPVALEPLMSLYSELDEGESGEVAFILASLDIRDERILRLLTERMEFDPHDTLMLLEIYGDPAAIPAIERFAEQLGDEDAEWKRDIAALESSLQTPRTEPDVADLEFDIWSLYPEKADLPLELLDDDQRLQLLDHEVAEIRSAAANSFFNRELTPGQRDRLLQTAKSDAADEVRARAWEALTTVTEEAAVIDAMLTALRNQDMSVTERGGLLVGLAPEADRNEVRAAVLKLYETPEGKAKALEAMWRSLHASFRDYFAKHLDEADVEVRRAAIWGVGYYGIKTELDRVRKLFTDEDLRADALFAYALSLPADISRGRMKGLLTRIQKDANGLSHMEEELVKAALDERLMLAGKEPFFAQEED